MRQSDSPPSQAHTPMARSTTMTDKDSSGAPAPPPIVYFVCLVVGLGLDYLWPLPFLPPWIQYSVGFTVIASSFLLFGLVLREFSKFETSIDPYKPTTEIISTGPFGYSRNPVYVSMTMLIFGIAIAVDGLFILVMAIPAVLIIHYFVVLREETYLERKFGKDYQLYKAAVRRWV